MSCIVSLAYLIASQTLPSHRKVPLSPSPSPSNEDIVTSDDDEAGPDRTLSVLELFAIPIVRSICISTFLLGFVASGFNMVIVLVSYTRNSDGGLALSVCWIGLYDVIPCVD